MTILTEAAIYKQTLNKRGNTVYLGIKYRVYSIYFLCDFLVFCHVLSYIGNNPTIPLSPETVS